MIAIGEDKTTIYLTRGDVTDNFHKLAFFYPIYNFETKKEENYTFKLTDKIAFVEKRLYKNRSVKNRKNTC